MSYKLSDDAEFDAVIQRLPAQLQVRVANALWGRSLTEIRAMTTRDFRALRGMGERSIMALQAALSPAATDEVHRRLVDVERDLTALLARVRATLEGS